MTTGDAGFDPEPATADDVAHWGETVREECTSTLWLLHDRLSALPEAVCESVQRLIGEKGRLLREIGAVSRLRPAFAKTRFHGDLHLGQLLLVQNDFVITDFEGEPARPLAQRRSKSCVLRDVAGMLRSFNYAALSTLKRLTAERASDREVLEPHVRTWERRARAAFLSGYREGVAGAPSYPADEAQAQALIDFFTLEKALYEVRYELDNRPGWIDIPIGGLLALVARDKAGGAQGG